MSVGEATIASIARRCHMGLDSATLLQEVATGLARVVPFDGGYLGTTDPSTLLLTGGILVGHEPDQIPKFVTNEYLDADVMKFRDLAHGPGHVDWLDHATQGAPERSPRYRNLFRPLRMGDELRAAFVANGTCWGVMCITREVGSPAFRARDAAVVSRLASHVAEGLRVSLLQTSAAAVETDADGPGVIVLAASLSVVAATPAAQRWLAEIGGPRDAMSGLPFAACSAVATLQSLNTSMAQAAVQPRVRVRTLSGRWLVVHAAYLSADPDGQIAVVIESASTDETTPLVLEAYALTRKELEVTRLVLLGRSTKEIAAELHISEHTVKDHLKSIFDKAGVSSRRQLVAQILSDHHREGR